VSEPQAPPDAIAASPAAPWSGLLAVDKPLGVTSHDVVEKVRRRLKARGAGHLGTLDPGASGLLLLALGAATRCIPVWQGGEKTYEGTLELGVITSTQDLQGEVLERRPLTVSGAAVREAALAFVGETEQIPPMVPALRSHGRRLYELARRGEEVERAPRKVRVTEWTWLEFALPLARFRVRCSGGTYVRTLAHDLGQRLGTGAALKALRRLRSEPFGIERAVALSEIGVGERDALLARNRWDSRLQIRRQPFAHPKPHLQADDSILDSERHHPRRERRHQERKSDHKLPHAESRWSPVEKPARDDDVDQKNRQHKEMKRWEQADMVLVTLFGFGH